MTPATERLSREERSAQMREERAPAILAAAMACAQYKGYRLMSRGDVAARASCSRGLVSHYYGSMDDLRTAVMSEAVRTLNYAIIAQGLADGHAVARDAPDDVRAAAVAALA